MSGIELNKKRKYVPHLPSLLAVCELNYARFLNLLPDCDSHDLSYAFEISPSLRYQVTILESSRYTSTLQLSQKSDSIPKFMRPVIQARLYHDAQLAEVLNFQNIGAIRPSYHYPNKQMHQKNEKEMSNYFLSEWLSFCLQHVNTRRESQAQ